MNEINSLESLLPGSFRHRNKDLLWITQIIDAIECIYMVILK
jgi:hypothetical protein